MIRYSPSLLKAAIALVVAFTTNVIFPSFLFAESPTGIPGQSRLPEMGFHNTSDPNPEQITTGQGFVASSSAVANSSSRESSTRPISLAKNPKTPINPWQKDSVKKASQAQLPFISNHGQVDNGDVLYYTHTLGGTMFVTRTGELVYSLPQFEDSTAQDVSQSVYGQGQNDTVSKIDRIEGHKFQTRKITGGWALKEKLVGAQALIPQGTDQSGARINYFLGNDSSKWIIGATVHNTVGLGEVYPGIVMTLNAQGNNAEKVFTVKPGAKPEVIRVDIAGATSLTVNAQGQLVAGTGLGPVIFTAPDAYQEQDGQRVDVSVAYHLVDDHTYGFTVGKYNPALPLVIDPLAYSTYLGGNSQDWGYDIAVDAGGSTYVTGDTNSTDFPTTPGAFSQHNSGRYDTFVTKLHPDGTLAYSTYLGGSRSDYGYGIAVDVGGNIYVTGDTSSIDFPTTPGALSQHIHDYYGDAFVTKLHPDGTLAYSTYLGGGDYDVGEGIAVDAGGNIYVTGLTESINFPTTPGALSQYYGSYDAFVTKITFTTLSLDKTTLGRPSYCLFGRNSVNLSTGNFINEATDFHIPSAGPPLAFTRFYNSQDDYIGKQGKGWTNNLNVHLTINQDGSIGVAYADGHVYKFGSNSGAYTAPSGCYETLTANSDGTYTLAFKDHTQYIFNSTSQLISITDKNNNTITLTYNNNLLTSATDSLGRSLTFAYDTNNQLASVTDPIGRTVSYTYDADGNLATVQDVDNGITRYQYDTHGLTKIIQPNNNTILTNTYDDNNRITSQTDGEGNTWTYAYTPDQRTVQTGPLGETTTCTREDKYRGIGVIDPLGGYTAFNYDDNNNCTNVRDAKGSTDTYAYDANGNLTSHTDTSGSVTQYTYDSNNNLTAVEEGYGTTDSRTTTYAYDDRNNLISATDTGGATTTYQYYPYSDSHLLKGLLWNQTSPGTEQGQGTITYTYDDNCYPATVTDAAGITTITSYDPVGRLLTSAEGGRTTAYTYDAAGNVLSVTDPKKYPI